MDDQKNIRPEDVLVKSVASKQKFNGYKGEVEAIVAGIGNRDRVGDIIVSGAFANSLRNRVPKVCWGHDWNKPIGKVLDIKELPPTDKRLPEKLQRVGGGGLWAKIAFNMSTQRGRDAFYDVKFYGKDQEWSIGYKTLKSHKNNNLRANMLEEIDLYELSPVLYGANNLTGTVAGSLKSHPLGGDQFPVTTPTNFNPGQCSPKLAQTISMALQRPISVRRVSQGMDGHGYVVVETEPGTWWKVPFTGDETHGYSVRNPTRLMGSMIPTPEEGARIMQVKFGEEDEGVGFESEDEAKSLSDFVGCDTGSHKADEGFLPCSSEEEYKQAVDKFQEGSSTLSEKTGCSCESTKSALDTLVEMSADFDHDEAIKEKLDAVISEIDKKENNVDLSGFALGVTCSVEDAAYLEKALADEPLLVSSSPVTLGIALTDVKSHDALLDAISLALVPMKDRINISVTDNRK